MKDNQLEKTIEIQANRLVDLINQLATSHGKSEYEIYCKLTDSVSQKMVADYDTKVIRLKLGMTQSEFAQALGTNVTTISRWENGIAKPNALYRSAIDKLVKKIERKRK